MTESLKSFLEHQAASVAFRPPDLNAISRDNDRRVRRRRMVTLFAGVVVLAVLAGAAVIWSNVDRRQPDVVTGPVPSGGASWAVGTKIFDNNRPIEVGHPVRALVRTSVGFVTIDNSHNVYSVTSNGVTQIGQALAVPADGTEYLRLFSDPRDTMAAWVGWEDSSPVLKVHDQATGNTRTYETGGLKFFAIDGRKAYLSVTRGVFTLDLDTGAENKLAEPGEVPGLMIWSVENGVLAFSKDHRVGQNVIDLNIGRAFDDSRKFGFPENAEANDVVRLSPTGQWLAYLLFQFKGPPVHDDVSAITAQVMEVSTGELISLKIPVTGFVLPAMWLDDSTLQLLALGTTESQEPKAGMYTCRVPDGSCVLVTDLPLSSVDGSNMVLPTGEWIGQ